jgi:hypothetical protein
VTLRLLSTLLFLFCMQSQAFSDWELWDQNHLFTEGINGSGLTLLCGAPQSSLENGLYIVIATTGEVSSTFPFKQDKQVGLQTKNYYLLSPQLHFNDHQRYLGPLPDSILSHLADQETVGLITNAQVTDEYGIRDTKLLRWFTAQCEARLSFNSSQFSGGTVLQAYRDRSHFLTTARTESGAFANSPIIKLLLKLLQRDSSSSTKATLAANFTASDDVPVHAAASDSQFIFAADGSVFLSYGFLQAFVESILDTSGLRHEDVLRWTRYLQNGDDNDLELELRLASLSGLSLVNRYAVTMQFLVGKRDLFESDPYTIADKLYQAHQKFVGAARLIGAHELGHLNEAKSATDCNGFQESELDADAWAVDKIISLAKRHFYGVLSVGVIFDSSIGIDYFFNAAGNLESASSLEGCKHPDPARRLLSMRRKFDSLVNRKVLAESLREKFLENLHSHGIKRSEVLKAADVLTQSESPETIGLSKLSFQRSLHIAYLKFLIAEMKGISELLK